MTVSFSRIGCSLLLFGIAAQAFMPYNPSKSHSSVGSSRLFGFGKKYDSFESSRYEDALARNKARTDVRNFLTQRAIQSFVYLLNQLRDPHTVNWMENVLEFNNLEGFHGTGAFNISTFPTWDSALVEMISRPLEVVVVSVKKRARSHRGWSNNGYLDNLGKTTDKSERSKDNPYLEERFVEYEIDIDPAALVSRIISVREQLSNEWVHDLETLITTNDQVLTTYVEAQNEARASAEEVDDDELDDDELDDDEDDEVDEDEDDEDQEIQDMMTPYKGQDQSQQSVLVFDRNAMMSNLNDFGNRDSSPLRKKNFDLLILLCTQEAIHRVLREYMVEGKNDFLDLLREFYTERVAEYFDGPQSYGRADDFLEELLLEPPSFHETKGGDVNFIDPIAMVEDIIQKRSEVAEEWKELVAESPNDHMDLRRMLLINMMGKSDEKSKKEKDDEYSAHILEMVITEDIGVFE